ncbi:MAG TPA: phosphomannomutase/phosphoglucomutase [Dongiaceae bacterium]|nr:phosphomannomutase/phosphoglucomutase [Dongiaceae bacterium]
MTGHNFHRSILREYDIRGIVGETLFEADAEWIGRAYGTVLTRKLGRTPIIALGRDGRLSSPQMAAALLRGLTSTGAKVLDVGCGPTPMAYFAVYHLETDGGIMVTGSHNPPTHNGFKMMIGRKPFYGAAIQQLATLAASNDVMRGSGTQESRPVLTAYVDRLASELADVDLSGLAIGWDAGNGAAGEAMTLLTKKLPGKHVLLHERIDGTFPAHHPDPTEPKNLVDLQQAVAQQKLDLGIAFDGDGDRIGTIDAKGRILWGDQMLAILARDVLKDRPGGTIIADVKASQVLFDEVARLGGKPMMWKTGHSLIKVKMAEVQSPLGGEMSGHIFFADRFYGFDDALYAAVRLLKAVVRHGGDLAALRDQLPTLVSTPELRFECADERKFKVVEQVRDRLKGEAATFDDIDGVRVNTRDGWWLLRASNTQAVLVARAEARDQAGLARLKSSLCRHLESSGVAVPVEMAQGAA